MIITLTCFLRAALPENRAGSTRLHEDWVSADLMKWATTESAVKTTWLALHWVYTALLQLCVLGLKEAWHFAMQISNCSTDQAAEPAEQSAGADMFELIRAQDAQKSGYIPAPGAASKCWQKGRSWRKIAHYLCENETISSMWTLKAVSSAQ